MEGTIEIGPRVRDHLDLADLEFGPGGVTRPGRFAAEIIANNRRRQAFVSYHPVLDRVAEVDEVAIRHSNKMTARMDETRSGDLNVGAALAPRLERLSGRKGPSHFGR